MKIPALLLALPLVVAVAVQDEPERAQPREQHKWLQQMVGEWTAEVEAIMAPGAEPMRMQSTEKVRAIGGLWILAEGTASFQGAPFTSLLTLGYDPEQESFVGTWVDTMQTRLWTYTGKLDEAKKVLTLESEGPSFAAPGKSTRYRDVIELKDADHKTLTSSVLGEDGKWTTFVTAHYQRKK